jgi:hypothetical protein
VKVCLLFLVQGAGEEDGGLFGVLLEDLLDVADVVFVAGGEGESLFGGFALDRGRGGERPFERVGGRFEGAGQDQLGLLNEVLGGEARVDDGESGGGGD